MQIAKVHIAPGRMTLLVQFDETDARYTTPAIASAAISVHPLLTSHSCINSEGPTFGTVIDHTSIAPLLEHLIIAEQSQMAQARGVSDATFVGTTEWIGDGHDAAQVQVSFLDDLEAVQALNNAMRLLGIGSG